MLDLTILIFSIIMLGALLYAATFIELPEREKKFEVIGESQLKVFEELL